jgi:hypothetical protein
MPISSTTAAPNALLLLSDLGGGKPPDTMRGLLIASTPTCIAIGCMSDCNGKTEVTIGAAREFGLSEPPAFEGELESPSRALAVQTVLGKTILKAPVHHSKTQVRIWVNHPSEPNKITIALS